MQQRPDAIDISALPVRPLDVGRPVAEQIFDVLKAAILQMTLPPGCLVSETEIGQLFGASRTPVREAFTQLRNDGLIETQPSRGNFVTKLSEDHIRDAQFIREALELAAVRFLCIDGLPDLARAELERILDNQTRAIEDNDPLAFQAEDDRFHTCLVAATGRGRMATLLIREKAVLDRLRVLALSQTERMPELRDEHGKILDAIVSPDMNAARRAMRGHLRAVLRDLDRLKLGNEAYFV